MNSHLRLAVPPTHHPFPTHHLPTPSKPISTTTTTFSPLLLHLHSLYPLLLLPLPPLPFAFLAFLLSSLLLFPKPSSLPSPLLLRSLAIKSLLLSLSFLLRLLSLPSLGAPSSALLSFSASLAAQSLSGRAPARGLVPLAASVLLLVAGFHRCGWGSDGCAEVVPAVMALASGLLGWFETGGGGNWAVLRPLGRKKVRFLTVAFATVWLFFPAVVAVMLVGEEEERFSGSVSGFIWALANAAVFGIVIGKNGGEERVAVGSKDVEKEFLFTFFGMLVFELFYGMRLSLPGFFVCGMLMWIAVKQLGSANFGYIDLGSYGSSESLYVVVMNPLRHILSERKSRKIALFLLINTAYMVVEFVAGFMSNSLGLLSDACHMLFDCAALAIGLYASYISRLPSNSQFNYGWGRFEVLSGYVNAVFLVLVGALIVLESLERILDPQEIATGNLLSVSVGGFLVNMVGLIFFHEEHHHAHGGSCSHSHSHGHADVGGGSCSHSHSHDDSHTHVGDGSCSHTHSHSYHHSQIHKVHEQATIMNHHHASELDGHRVSVENTIDDIDHHCKKHDHNHHHHSKDSHNNVDAGSVALSCGHNCHAHHHSHFVVDDHVKRDAKEEEHVSGSSLGVSHSHRHLNHTHDKFCDDGGALIDHGPLNISIMPNPEHSHFSSHHGKLPTNGKSKEQKKHHHVDHNMEGIFLHVLADTLGSVGVIFSTLLIKYKGWLAADPACSIFISIMIISSVLPLLRNSAEILLQRTPRAHEKDLTIALDSITRINGVSSIQNMKTWSFTNAEVIGTLHLQVSTGNDKEFVKKKVLDILNDVGIKDLTIQVEHSKA